MALGVDLADKDHVGHAVDVVDQQLACLVVAHDAGGQHAEGGPDVRGRLRGEAHGLIADVEHELEPLQDAPQLEFDGLTLELGAVRRSGCVLGLAQRFESVVQGGIVAQRFLLLLAGAETREEADAGLGPQEVDALLGLGLDGRL